MNILNNQMRELRKLLDLSQAAFGERIGLSRDEIKNIEYDKTTVKEIKIPIICRMFNVSYDWLTKGEGEPFESLPKVLIDELAMQYGLDDEDKRIVQSYLELPEEDRAAIKRYINKLLGK